MPTTGTTRFELGLIGLGIPFEDHVMHSMLVLWPLVWLVLLVTVLLTGALIFYTRTRISRILIAMSPAWILLIFVLAYLLGNYSGSLAKR